ncbi:cysteine-rich receptor-like protein kinase 10, partial [Fagus crenata]
MGVPSINFRMSLLVLTLLIIFLSQNRTEAVPTFINSACPNISTFNVNTPNNTYQSNRNNLLLYLSSNATGNTEYYNATASTVSSVEDTVYGLFVCRGDMSADDCRDCVADATKVIVNLCPVQKAAIAWYEQCMIRYSNRYIFSSMAPDPSFYFWSPLNISEPDRFNQLVQTTMNDLASQLLNVRSGAKKFKTKEATFTALQTLYTLAQCTPDLSGADCNSCLKIATNTLPGCCGGKQEGTVLLPSCVIKYAVSPFYTVNTSVPTPTEALVPGSAITHKGKTRISTQTIVVIVASISVSAVLFVTGYCFLSRRQRKNYNVIQEENESLQFDFATIEAATDKFSDHNKLGEGGFGVVYKGLLPNKQEIAVKRLSKNSEQGLGEFKNEVVTVAKLQHRNLVRLLGFCLEGEEKILVYEYVANKSLDYFLYDPIRREKFDWSSRYKIIRGIARGILYLHEDSRLRIIHRDLKASNILLDQDMNPKISDFGMAKIFGVDETQGNTNRIVGTFGYMSPEYAMHGQFSVKSDVYSFGVLILEILSGQKNSSFCQENSSEDLLSY